MPSSVNDFRRGQVHEESVDRTGAGRDKNRPALLGKMAVRFTLSGVGEESDGIGASTRELDEDHFAELRAILRAEGFDELFDTVVESPDARDALDKARSAIAPTNCPRKRRDT